MNGENIKQKKKMILIERNNIEKATLLYILPSYDINELNFSIKYKSNINDVWETATIDSQSIRCCGYCVSVVIDTTEIKDGSYYFQLTDSNGNSSIEEYVIQSQKYENVSNYKGVKIYE